jgi:hypothetical protein
MDLTGNVALTSTICGNVTRPATGAISCRKLKFRWAYSAALMAAVVPTSNKVVPSGADFATASVARLPAAPGRFSTMHGWPSRSASHCPMSRAKISEAPPGANPTTIRSGFSENVCAPSDWKRLSAGAGTKGPRLHEGSPALVNRHVCRFRRVQRLLWRHCVWYPR